MKYVKKVLPLLAISLVTIVVLHIFYNNILKAEEKRCWNELSTTVQDLNDEITIKFNDEISKLHLLETMIKNGDIASGKNLSYLHLDKVQPGTMFERIDILYPDNTLLSNGKLVELDEEISFDKIKANGEYLTERKTDFMTGKLCVYYVLPITSNDEVSAVLIGVIDLGILYDFFKPVLYNGEANICIIDSDDGNYIMDSWHNELGNVYKMKNRTLLEAYKDVDFKSEIKNQKTGSIAFVSETTGKNIYMYYAPLGIFGWETAVFTQEDVLFSNLVALRKRVILMGTIEIILFLVYFLWNTYLIKQLQKSNKEIELKSKELKFLSYHDTLTGLYNRHKYTETLSRYANTELLQIGVAYIDLNALKQINDTNSHEAGDQYICKTADILAEHFGEHCYRIGGDEFVILLPDVEKTDFKNLIKSLKRNMVENNISISIGYLWQDSCNDIDTLLHEAEKNMYIEKNRYYQTQN